MATSSASALTGAEHVLFRSSQFQHKLVSALALIKHALSLRPNIPSYVAFSGGKDSLAVAALVQMATGNDAMPLCWSDDELEYPEHVEYMLQLAASEPLLITLGWAEHAGWFKPWLQEPYFREPITGAVRVDQPAEDWYASAGYELTFTGLRAEESSRRANHLYSVAVTRDVAGLYRASTGWRCTPIWDWTADDVWALIAEWQLPYSPIYNTLSALGVPRKQQRVGPLPLARQAHLEEGWPDLYRRLTDRYGQRWR